MKLDPLVGYGALQRIKSFHWVQPPKYATEAKESAKRVNLGGAKVLGFKVFGHTLKALVASEGLVVIVVILIVRVIAIVTVLVIVIVIVIVREIVIAIVTIIVTVIVIVLAIAIALPIALAIVVTSLILI